MRYNEIVVARSLVLSTMRLEVKLPRPPARMLQGFLGLGAGLSYGAVSEMRWGYGWLACSVGLALLAYVMALAVWKR